MICKECVAAQQKSRVYSGGSFRTAAAYETYWDEDGRRHFHDGNVTTSYFRCDNGHTWEQRTMVACPTCGEWWKK